MSVRAHDPDLKKYLDKKLIVRLNGRRRVEGYLSGFDAFMNIVLNNAIETTKEGNEIPIGMTVVRGNSINLLEGVDRM